MENYNNIPSPSSLETPKLLRALWCLHASWSPHSSSLQQPRPRKLKSGYDHCLYRSKLGMNFLLMVPKDRHRQTLWHCADWYHVVCKSQCLETERQLVSLSTSYSHRLHSSCKILFQIQIDHILAPVMLTIKKHLGWSWAGEHSLLSTYGKTIRFQWNILFFSIQNWTFMFNWAKWFERKQFDHLYFVISLRLFLEARRIADTWTSWVLGSESLESGNCNSVQ